MSTQKLHQYGRDSGAFQCVLRLFVWGCLFWWAPQVVFAQAEEAKQTALTPSFRFKDGVYFSFAECQSDQPRYQWQDLGGHLVSNPKTLIAKVESLDLVETGAPVSLDSIWGLSIDGIPYIKVGANASYATFAGFSARGAICFFSFEADTLQNVEIVAYNPVTGRPFRKGAVKNKETLKYDKMMRWETGAITTFNRHNFLNWIADDQQLLKTVKDLPKDESDKKMFKSLLIYNDRHIVYLNK